MFGARQPGHLVRGGGAGPRPDRRERRGQDHADERALRTAAARRGTDPDRRAAGCVSFPEGRHRGRHRHGAPALHAGARVHRGGERDPRHRGDPPVRPARPAQDPQGRAGAFPPLWSRDRPGRAGREPAGRHPAAGRDRQGPGQAGEGADPRRADRGAHPGRDRRPVPHHQAAEGRRHVRRLHLAQAQGSPGHRGHDHRAAPRCGRRREAAVRQRGRTRRADGGPERAVAGEQAAGQARRRGARRERPDRRRRDGQDLGERNVLAGPFG